MAAQPEELQVEEKPAGKGKLFIIIGVIVVLLLAAGGYFLLSGDSAEPAPATIESLDEANPANGATAGDVQMGSALYVAMPRPFVFNVPGSQRDRLVQIKVQLLVRGAQNEETTKKHIPLIEGTLLRIFSGASADQLGTTAGKEALKNDSLKAVQDEMLSITGRTVIEKVLFTGFVMQ
ncbi:flagellar basal body-associated protein FliL [Catenovulum sp. 2E275]|uniref:flagellar basal body-associated protein FliL n=1 Tax=Catenovulum sp. 2E275 TaxID=2980497 RepID=UPI0021CF18E9|nr:flagellar basal body-associated protein FliL [Catenovulum sp. 2E275]MCU4674712.1 flagellar basal body-associated protein FliL [Catenovulum sp. 2E275]